MINAWRQDFLLRFRGDRSDQVGNRIGYIAQEDGTPAMGAVGNEKGQRLGWPFCTLMFT